ncbi:uncharacterized protein LOC134564470 [Prinia subflava]|uniref:uncharacterized protein LOC134564470 n=1 Tax=Prinia subflava TaxID=208062 RepID=UPI002FE2BDEC
MATAECPNARLGLRVHPSPSHNRNSCGAGSRCPPTVPARHAGGGAASPQLPASAADCPKMNAVPQDMVGQLKDVEVEHDDCSEMIRLQAILLDLRSKRQERLVGELEAAIARTKELEENAEAARLAQIECEQKTPIMQLRIQELEDALKEEQGKRRKTFSVVEQQDFRESENARERGKKVLQRQHSNVQWREGAEETEEPPGRFVNAATSFSLSESPLVTDKAVASSAATVLPRLQLPILPEEAVRDRPEAIAFQHLLRHFMDLYSLAADRVETLTGREPLPVHFVPKAAVAPPSPAPARAGSFRRCIEPQAGHTPPAARSPAADDCYWVPLFPEAASPSPAPAPTDTLQPRVSPQAARTPPATAPAAAADGKSAFQTVILTCMWIPRQHFPSCCTASEGQDHNIEL